MDKETLTLRMDLLANVVGCSGSSTLLFSSYLSQGTLMNPTFKGVSYCVTEKLDSSLFKKDFVKETELDFHSIEHLKSDEHPLFNKIIYDATNVSCEKNDVISGYLSILFKCLKPGGKMALIFNNPAGIPSLFNPGESNESSPSSIFRTVKSFLKPGGEAKKKISIVHGTHFNKLRVFVCLKDGRVILSLENRRVLLFYFERQRQYSRKAKILSYLLMTEFGFRVITRIAPTFIIMGTR